MYVLTKKRGLYLLIAISVFIPNHRFTLIRCNSFSLYHSGHDPETDLHALLAATPAVATQKKENGKILAAIKWSNQGMGEKLRDIGKFKLESSTHPMFTRCLYRIIRRFQVRRTWVLYDFSFSRFAKHFHKFFVHSSECFDNRNVWCHAQKGSAWRVWFFFSATDPPPIRSKDQVGDIENFERFLLTSREHVIRVERKVDKQFAMCLVPESHSYCEIFVKRIGLLCPGKAGCAAISLEGKTRKNFIQYSRDIMDLFLKSGEFYRWIGFAACRNRL